MPRAKTSSPVSTDERRLIAYALHVASSELEGFPYLDPATALRMRTLLDFEFPEYAGAFESTDDILTAAAE